MAAGKKGSRGVSFLELYDANAYVESLLRLSPAENS